MVLDRQHIFDTAIEIARHPVRRGNEQFRVVVGQRIAVAERPDAAVFEKTADHRLDADALGHLGHARAQTADAAHHEIDRSEEHTSELQSLMRISYAVFCLKKKNIYHANSRNTKTRASSNQHKRYS